MGLETVTARPVTARRLSRLLLLLLLACSESRGDEKPIGGRAEARHQAVNTISPSRDQKADARNCVQRLIWKPARFEVEVQQRPSTPYDRLVRFPSAKPSGTKSNDLVALEWFQARGASGAIKKAPALVVVHESGSNMNVGRLFARTLRAAGFHTFLIHLPYYGERREGKKPPVAEMIKAIDQAVADVRRARDAIAALPVVQRPLGVQGTSLGGFVVATASSLDRGFDCVFIMLAGGRLYDILQNGKKDAVEIRQRLKQTGLNDEQIKDVLWRIEPTRVAHRLNPKQTWIYSARDDTIVPLANAKALAKAAKMADDHHVVVAGNHYSCVASLPRVFIHIVARMRKAKASQPDLNSKKDGK